MKHYGKTIPGVRQKEKGSLVTDIDIRCNNLIIREIKRRFPTHSIITEESSPIDNESPYTWHIDPIDGTHNYIRGLPLFGVSVAAAKNGKVVMGVICLPAFGKLYAAERGKGAFCNGRRIRVSPRRAIDYSFILFDSSASMRRKKLAFMHRIAGRMFNERVLGCAVYAAAMVAEGKSDAFVCFRTNSWDIAAGFLLIQEAGGRSGGPDHQLPGGAVGPGPGQLCCCRPRGAGEAAAAGEAVRVKGHHHRPCAPAYVLFH